MRLFCSAGLGGSIGKEGLLAEAIGDFGDIALIDANRRKIIELADKVEGAQGFPDLLGAGIDGGNFRAGRYRCSCRDRKRANAPADRCANFGGALSVLELGDQAALANRSSNLIYVDDAPGGGSGNGSGLQESDDLRPTCGVAKTYQRKRGVATNHLRGILQHS